MDELLKINEAAVRYNVTKRALRYYEEIGILSSKRKGGSDYRYYDRETLDKLEQILLLKGLNFQISEIKEIILSKDEEFIDKILHNKLSETQKDIDALFDNKKVISAILRIKERQGAKGINFYEVIKEQIYIQSNIERVIDMNQYVGDMIIIEFGINIVPFAEKLIQNIKELRKEIEGQIQREIPLMRIRDRAELKDDQYRILIKGVIISDEVLESTDQDRSIAIIINALRSSINSNIEALTSN